MKETHRMERLKINRAKFEHISLYLHTHMYINKHGSVTSFVLYIYIYGDRGSTVVKALCYNSEGRWFDSR